MSIAALVATFTFLLSTLMICTFAYCGPARRLLVNVKGQLLSKIRGMKQTQQEVAVLPVQRPMSLAVPTSRENSSRRSSRCNSRRSSHSFPQLPDCGERRNSSNYLPRSTTMMLNMRRESSMDRYHRSHSAAGSRHQSISLSTTAMCGECGCMMTVPQVEVAPYQAIVRARVRACGE